jgi:hypothetical protein
LLGTGFLTYAFLHHTNARKVIALEKERKYAEELLILAKESNGRLEIINVDVWGWGAYDMLKYHLKDIKVHPWEEGILIKKSKIFILIRNILIFYKLSFSSP